jgi:hypothetical protein
MTNTEKMQAAALVENMVAHGYSLMPYPTAQAMVDYYEDLPLDWWQETHDEFVATRGGYSK